MFTAISFLFITVQATYAVTVTITATSARTYSVEGDAMDGVAGIDLTIFYDTLSVSSPTVSPGSLIAGSYMVANTSNPGSIKIAIINTRGLSGNGQIATVTFDTQSGTGGITSSLVSMSDSKGSPIAAQVVVSGLNTTDSTASGLISTPGVPYSQSSSASTATSTTATAASTPSTYQGTGGKTGNVQPKSDTKPADTRFIAEKSFEPAEAKPVGPQAEVKPFVEPQKPAEVRATTYKGVLETFRVYKGKKTPAILLALINTMIAPAIRQEPAVVLSDGQATVKILAKLQTADDKSPNIFLSGARLVSLKRDTSFEWIIEAQPMAGIVSASLTILTDSEIIEYPLTLSPPVEGVSPVEADFAVYLTDSGAATPKRDLNGDGRHDYLDDFIYTANYLMSKSASGKIKKSETVQTAAPASPAPASSAAENFPEQKPDKYTLSSGVIVSRPKRDILVNKLKAAGLQPTVREEQKAMDVYRLVTGCFSAITAAQKRLAELARREKQAFIVHDNGQFCVVMASYFSYEAASARQNISAKKGLRAEIVKAEVPLTSWQVTTGSYNDGQSAAAELKRLAERRINLVIVPHEK
jgi:hypothetical protein